jgi:NAD(P)-dependent dehydrogenase (short-subunit alcohol dehydrogenase family)
MKTLRDKVVVITGAGSGIGRALAAAAAGQRAILALSDRDEAAVAETARLAGAPTSLVRRVDVRSDDEVRAFASAVEADFGGAHVVVNNAGVSLSDTVRSMQRSDFEWLFDINFWGVVRGTEAFLPQLLRRDDAHVVNISSVFGLVAVPSQSAYNASKFAVRGYTESLRQELEDTPVRVTCVHPGGVRTNIVRAGRHHQNSHGEPITVEQTARQFDKLARTSPEAAARTIWSGVLANRPRVLIGRDAQLIDLVQRLFPARYPALFRGAQQLFERASGVRL